MSWADKQLKKHKLRKQIKEIMDSPEFQKERQKELDKHTAEAMNCFLLISVDYLYRNYHCKRNPVIVHLLTPLSTSPAHSHQLPSPALHSSAENKREKALELAKEGKGAAEIARLIDAKYSTVYSWLNPDKCKKPKPENKTASNADRHKCRTCMFRATGNTKGAGCSYIEITGHSRGCSVEECSVYQKGDAVSKRKMKGFYE